MNEPFTSFDPVDGDRVSGNNPGRGVVKENRWGRPHSGGFAESIFDSDIPDVFSTFQEVHDYRGT